VSGQRTAISSAIPQLRLMAVTQSVSSERNISHSSGLPIISAPLKHHSTLSSASVLVSSPSTSGSAVYTCSALTSTPNVLKQSPSLKSVHVSSPGCRSTGSIHSNSTSTCTESDTMHQAHLFRTQMILFQQSGRPHLLEIASNCAWERSRPKVLGRLCDLIKASDGYPRPCTVSVDGFQMEVQSRPKFPTEIPVRLRESLGMSSLFSIRMRITAEEKPLATSNFVFLPCNQVTAKLSAQGVGSTSGDPANGRTTVCITQQKTNTAASQQNTDADNITRSPSTSLIDAGNGMHERTAVELSQQATSSSIGTTCQQETNMDMNPQIATADISRQMESDLSADADNSLNKDSTNVSKSGISDNVLEAQLKPLSGPVPGGIAAYDINGYIGCCSVDTGSNVNRLVSASNSAYSDNAGNCAALQCHGKDAAMTRSDVSPKCTKTINSFLHANNGNSLPMSDSGNSPSSSSQTVPVTEVTCSLQADDGNFRSSPGLNVPIGCSLDLCT